MKGVPKRWVEKLFAEMTEAMCAELREVPERLEDLLEGAQTPEETERRLEAEFERITDKWDARCRQEIDRMCAEADRDGEDPT